MVKNFTLACIAIVSLLILTFCASATSSGKGKGSVAIDASSKSAVVDTESGKIAGYVTDGLFVYKGIPYAKADRFMAPQPVEHWEGVRSCRHFGPTAPQAPRQGYDNDEVAFAFDWDDGYQGEDCQRINIWTPGINDGKKRPVMVWLHGGGYTAGSGQEQPGYDGAHLAQKGDVVVVTLNHRLNVLGFLDLSAYGEKYAESGNVGLLDLVAALQWVNKNIESFGGDPENVTIFGQSGGGGKVSILCATPAANGLFHKAIVQSGSTLRTMEQAVSRRIGVALMEELCLQPSQIDQLNDLPYADLLAAGNKAVARVREDLAKEGNNPGMLFGWSPTVDGNVLPTHPFDPGAPEQSRDIPMIIGTTLNEFAPSVYVPAMRNLTQEQAIEVARQTYGDHTDEFVEAFGQCYPGYKPNDLIDTDCMFRAGAVKQASRKAEQGGAPVWMYVFAWQSPILDGNLRATHCMEIPFVFNNADRHASMTGGGEEALLLADRMSQAWINFARTGNPNGEKGIEGMPTWEPFTAEGGVTMWWDNQSEIKYNHDKPLLIISEQVSLKGL